jgi:hypothetical protein
MQVNFFYFIQTFRNSFVYTRKRVRACADVRACVCARARVRERVCVCVCASFRKLLARTFIPFSIKSYSSLRWIPFTPLTALSLCSRGCYLSHLSAMLRKQSRYSFNTALTALLEDMRPTEMSRCTHSVAVCVFNTDIWITKSFKLRITKCLFVLLGYGMLHPHDSRLQQKNHLAQSVLWPRFEKGTSRTEI